MTLLKVLKHTELPLLNLLNECLFMLRQIDPRKG